jgi:hypothetical protein
MVEIEYIFGCGIIVEDNTWLEKVPMAKKKKNWQKPRF